jgi:hypothetical protein
MLQLQSIKALTIRKEQKELLKGLYNMEERGYDLTDRDVFMLRPFEH